MADPALLHEPVRIVRFGAGLWMTRLELHGREVEGKASVASLEEFMRVGSRVRSCMEDPGDPADAEFLLVQKYADIPEPRPPAKRSRDERVYMRHRHFDDALEDAYLKGVADAGGDVKKAREDLHTGRLFRPDPHQESDPQDPDPEEEEG